MRAAERAVFVDAMSTFLAGDIDADHPTDDELRDAFLLLRKSRMSGDEGLKLAVVASLSFVLVDGAVTNLSDARKVWAEYTRTSG